MIFRLLLNKVALPAAVSLPSRSVPGASDDSEVVWSCRPDAYSHDSAEPGELRAQSEACGSLGHPGDRYVRRGGAQLQFKAIGTYIHPPENKDVTQQVKWSIDSQHLVTIDGPGLVTAISDCGTGNVMASIQEGGNYVFSTAFVSAAGVGTSTCTQASLTVEISGNGTVTSTPPAITCPGTCTAAFPLDSNVVLTAAPGAGASTVTWTWDTGTTGCTNPTATTCSVALETNATILATFQ